MSKAILIFLIILCSVTANTFAVIKDFDFAGTSFPTKLFVGGSGIGELSFKSSHYTSPNIVSGDTSAYKILSYGPYRSESYSNSVNGKATTTYKVNHSFIIEAKKVGKFTGLRFILKDISGNDSLVCFSDSIQILAKPQFGKKAKIKLPSLNFNMIRVRGGKFVMGTDAIESTSLGTPKYSNAQPAHSESVKTFFIADKEVTVGLWNMIMGSQYRRKGNPACPVTNISFNDCLIFIKRLNNFTGLNFRLPKESEWEYAARGGVKSRNFKYSGSNSPYSVAVFRETSGNVPWKVGQKNPNELGIYDMSGNVSEYVNDYMSNNYYSPRGTGKNAGYIVIRGGNFDSFMNECTVWARDREDKRSSSNYIGFRLALDSE